MTQRACSGILQLTVKVAATGNLVANVGMAGGTAERVDAVPRAVTAGTLILKFSMGAKTFQRDVAGDGRRERTGAKEPTAIEQCVANNDHDDEQRHQ